MYWTACRKSMNPKFNYEGDDWKRTWGTKYCLLIIWLAVQIVAALVTFTDFWNLFWTAFCLRVTILTQKLWCLEIQYIQLFFFDLQQISTPKFWQHGSPPTSWNRSSRTLAKEYLISFVLVWKNPPINSDASQCHNHVFINRATNRHGAPYRSWLSHMLNYSWLSHMLPVNCSFLWPEFIWTPWI